MAEDSYGKGLLSFLNGNEDAFFVVESDIAETEEWPVSVFFREYEQMPEVEKAALRRCRGSVLDVGAGAGSHALYLQQEECRVAAIDISPGAVETMKKRGVEKVFLTDYFKLTGQKYDTLLMLMNGIGIAGKLERLPAFFEQAKRLLNPRGKIILDSSDLVYLFEEDDEDAAYGFNHNYYGELSYTFEFEGVKDEPFNWLFVDFDTLSQYADKSGFKCVKLCEDEHFLYAAELELK